MTFEPLRRFRPAVLFCALVAGCTNAEEDASMEATMKSDGYALFSVENGRQQVNDVHVRVRDDAGSAGAVYVLIYSEAAPTNVGWFQYDPTSRIPCHAEPNENCEIPGYGYVVDIRTVPPGASEVTLRDSRCGCDTKDYKSSWTGHWAVMRLERPNRTNAVSFDVHATRLKNYAEVPDVRQLQ